MRNRLPTSFLDPRALCADVISALRITYLLQPEASSRRVEQAQKFKVLVVGRIGRKLNDRRVTVKDLSARVEMKVVVGRDITECDRPRWL